MRLEVSDLNEKKLNLASEIESLHEQKRQTKADLEGLGKEILNLRQMKLEEQNLILTYSEKIDQIKDKVDKNGYENLERPKHNCMIS